MNISEEKLLADGWVKTGDPVVLFQKKISNRNPINNDPEDTDISLILHGWYNAPNFAVLFADGGMLNFNPNSMEELKAFEEMLNFYDVNY